MGKLITGILSVFIVTGILGVYIPNALATLGTPLEICNGNSAGAQDGGSAAEQETNQELAGDTGAQSVSPEFNALNGNNLGFESQQNGDCLPIIDQPPVGDSTVPGLRN
ncbi:hypothetical protein [Candidatus Nitrosocosmicus arcticus]|uniref:Uncharacterized protein n=1 Tax=Candidatus Nitrosocosmicus arcticus TaxID=2035267 RepID=A0A557SXT9_9ARCH|nr:hypothetical protein [Candidatus Nitrosocosmicus arcticus]TVP41415.1 hypothetical protein NARC_30129 [Candidatus Nitrosocosmicus arcticus]